MCVCVHVCECVGGDVGVGGACECEKKEEGEEELTHTTIIKRRRNEMIRTTKEKSSWIVH